MIGQRPTELPVVAINCNLSPDAEDRLHCLVSLLLRHTDKDRQAETAE